jgi:alkane 1-monooxygenase
MRDFKYLSALIVPLLSLTAFKWPDKFAFLPLAFSFILVPLLDLFIRGREDKNITPEQEAAKGRRFLFDAFLYLCVPLQWGVIVSFLYFINKESNTPVQIAGIVTATGLCTGIIGINVAHELGHRKKSIDRFCSKLLLLSSLYMHFFIEHNKGHHKKVGTAGDPATAKLGESVYAFIGRCIIGSYRSAWQIQLAELRKKEKSFLSFSNQMLIFQVLQALLVLAICAFWSPVAALYFMATALIGILLLEIINYIEHYGLQRREIQPGKFERVAPSHSWSAEHPVGRAILFELTRHADHHYLASRKYQVLRKIDNSPQLPAGYPAMMLLSLMPRLWFRTMNPLAIQYNLSPEKILTDNHTNESS